MRADPEAFLEAVRPFSDDMAAGVECMFTWYRLAELGRDEGIPFVLGHALYMKAIHGAKAENDRTDSAKDRRPPQSCDTGPTAPAPPTPSPTWASRKTSP